MIKDHDSEPKRKKIDLSGFDPEPRRLDPTLKMAATNIANEAGFTTRHRQPEPAPTPPAVMRRGRKRQTGRNTQFTVKLRAETNNAIYTLADRLDVTALAEVIEMAVDALEEKLRTSEIG